MADSIEQMSGPQRAAIFLLGVGEKGAAAVMRHMEPKEVQSLGEAMAGLSNVSNEQIASVIENFAEEVSGVNPLSIGADDFTRRVMIDALGERKAANVLHKVLNNVESQGIEALRWMDPASVVDLIADEHPQIIALVLANLGNEHAADVLLMLPEATRAEVIIRIARLESIDPAAMKELDKVLAGQLKQVRETAPSTVQGMSTAVAIIKNLDTVAENALLDAVAHVDTAIGESIRDKMFVFDNLVALDDRGMQRLIRDISVDDLVIALKGVDQELQGRFFDNMSSRAAEMLKEDLESKGPVKLVQVREHQKTIMTIAARLIEEGEIHMGKGGEEFV